MPIKLENRSRYPKDWCDIVARVRERSGDCCEGSPAYPECRVPNGAIGFRVDSRFVVLGMTTEEAVAQIEHGFADGEKVIRIVLTTGHLDHTPENCELYNLRHWCQRCYLAYDAEHHRETSYMTRWLRRGNLELPL